MAKSPFPPIGDYGFLSDCHTGALVAPNGAVEWLCLPRFDSPSVFTAILDRTAGSFRFGPADVAVPARAPLRAGDEDPRDDMDDRERLGRRPRRPHGRRVARRLDAPAHPPSEQSRGGADPPAKRGVHTGRGRARGRLRPSLRLRRRCAAVVARRRRPLDGDRLRWRARRASHIRQPSSRSRATGSPQGGRSRPARAASARSHGAIPATTPRVLDEVNARLQVTSDFWREWLADGRFPDHPWRAHLQRSALTLKGLTYAPTGALVAALDDLAARDAGRRAQLGLPL